MSINIMPNPVKPYRIYLDKIVNKEKMKSMYIYFPLWLPQTVTRLLVSG